MAITGWIKEDGAKLFGIELTNLHMALQKCGFTSGGAITATGTPDMLTHVASSVVCKPTPTSVAAADLTHDAAHATLDRYDVIYIDDSHTTWQILKGTAAADPVVPSIAALVNPIVAAVITITHDDTAIAAGDIMDCRVLIPNEIMRNNDVDTDYASTAKSGHLGTNGVTVLTCYFAAGTTVYTTSPVPTLDYKITAPGWSVNLNGTPVSTGTTGGTYTNVDISAALRAGVNILTVVVSGGDSYDYVLDYVRHIKFRDKIASSNSGIQF
jgi:hypothetical protein